MLEWTACVRPNNLLLTTHISPRMERTAWWGPNKLLITKYVCPMMERTAWQRPNNHFFLVPNAGKDVLAAKLLLSSSSSRVHVAAQFLLEINLPFHVSQRSFKTE